MTPTKTPRKTKLSAKAAANMPKKSAAKTTTKKAAKPTEKAAAETLTRPSTKPSTKPLTKPAGQRQTAGRIHIGIGGWTFEPWRGVFYPKGLAHAKELAYASERLTSIEVNGTFYRSQTPATFRKWASEVPQGFVFALKGPRFATNRRVLKEAGDSIKRFLDSGVTELGAHLGPLLWQFAPTKKFDSADFGGFLELLPDKYNGHTIRHVVEVRHDSFSTPEFTALLRTFNMPVVFTDHTRYPNIADITGGFVYARLQRGKDTIVTAYPQDGINAWARRLQAWADGGAPDDLPLVEATQNQASAKTQPRDVFAYVIHEGKVRAPAGATALIEKLR
jgi:uncharacterized protein YecE (DUF72 family)